MKIGIKKTELYERTVTIKRKEKTNNTILIQNEASASHQQPKIDNVNTNNNRTLIMGFSNCGKTYLINYMLLQKQEPSFIITKSLNQYLNIKAQTSDEIQPEEKIENSFVVFEVLLLSRQASNIRLFLTWGRHTKVMTHGIYLKAILISQKILFFLIQIKALYWSKL